MSFTDCKFISYRNPQDKPGHLSSAPILQMGYKDYFGVKGTLTDCTFSNDAFCLSAPGCY